MYSLTFEYCEGTSSLAFLFRVVLEHKWVSAITTSHVSLIAFLRPIFLGYVMYSLTFGYCEGVCFVAVFHAMKQGRELGWIYASKVLL